MYILVTGRLTDGSQDTDSDDLELNKPDAVPKMFPLSAKQYVRSEPEDLVLSDEAVDNGGAFTAEKELRCSLN